MKIILFCCICLVCSFADAQVSQPAANRFISAVPGAQNAPGPIEQKQASTPADTAVGEQAARFAVGSVTLSGTLLRPAGDGIFPGIVLLHGSGPGPRQELRRFAERFARLGFAALIFDKRGSGESGGSWTNESLDDLTDDALAAVAFMKAQPGIDSHRVGLWGISQSGWIIPHAAARAPGAFAFAVVVTGGGLRPRELEEYDYAAALDRNGVSGDDKREALALVTKYLNYLENGNDRAGLERSIDASRDKSWFKSVDVGRVLPTSSSQNKWAWVPSYDPSSDIQKIAVPILVLLGGKDRPGLSLAMNEDWKKNLAMSQSSDCIVVDFINAEHGATVAGTHHAVYSGGPPTFVPGYLETVDAWLTAHKAAASK